MKQIQIHPKDNVAVALEDMPGIPAGHKIALNDIAEGELVIKYGSPIGHAIRNIKKGEHIDHNDIHTNLNQPVPRKASSATTSVTPALQSDTHESKWSTQIHNGLFFLRPDGQVGIRNELWVIPTVGCVNGIVRRIVERVKAEVFREGEGVDAVIAFTHNYGCSQLGDDHENTRRILRDMVHHPNAGGILVVGLGCENNQPHEFERFCGEYDHEGVRFMTSQEVDGDEVEYGVRLLSELYRQACRFQRTKQPLSKLRIGLKCGGSDGLSGITANPLLGRFSDWLCLSQMGTTVLTEVPEMFGAEHLLEAQCSTPEIKRQTSEMIENFKQYFRKHGEPISENPSPGNKAGGISTLEEKALGCTQKAGTSPIRGVLPYSERIPKDGYGLHLLSAPGNDLVASTALAAAGCQLVLFTTGRGTPFSTFVPTLKVSTNSQLAKAKPHWIDFDAGTLIEGESMDDLTERFKSVVLGVCNGELRTASEQRGYAEIAIFKNGVTL